MIIQICLAKYIHEQGVLSSPHSPLGSREMVNTNTIFSALVHDMAFIMGNNVLYGYHLDRSKAFKQGV